MITNFDLKTVMVIWRPHCANVDVYNPKFKGDHQRVYWSVRDDGVYHSWDNVNWTKKTGWGSC